MIDTIVFDLGGVLVDWNPDYVFDKVFAGQPERKEHFFTNICTGDWNEMQDAGRPLAEATETLVAEHPEWESEIRTFYGRWSDMLGGPIDEVVEILKMLKADGWPLYALTNWSAETFPIAKERYDFLGWFDGIAVSGEENTRKPFREFFQILFDRYSIEPTRAVFIDDNLRNVAAAEEYGMHAIAFTTAAALKDSLRKLGVQVG
ncbi:MAG TPA: HAD family hydrolase [Planctomycetaceae bacterium]|nr:HAD family hydrolase [Planctomycetaceae bacterium]